jgi:hypothetical protein
MLSSTHASPVLQMEAEDAFRVQIFVFVKTCNANASPAGLVVGVGVVILVCEASFLV